MLFCVSTFSLCLEKEEEEEEGGGKKKIARGDKQTHLTLSPHGNQGAQQQKKNQKTERARERQEAGEKGCKQMLRDEE